MDHWGDPWADNADDALPPKHELPSPLPSTLASAPTLLNGFLDDAGWGNTDDNDDDDDDGFGVWATSPRKDTGPAASTEAATRLSSGHGGAEADKAPSSAGWDDVVSPGETLERDDADWSGAVSGLHEIENVVSETSDSATTVEPNEGTEAVAKDIPAQPQPDDGSSARPSTSPSEASRVEAPIESPRTSIDEEHVSQYPPQEDHAEEVEESAKDSASELTREASNSTHDEFGEFEEDAPDLDKPQDQAVIEVDDESRSTDSGEDAQEEKRYEEQPITGSTSALAVDSTLIAELFPLAKAADEPDEAPGDPIYSTPARKAWYRLTRKQTMREFNTGNDDDNYIRVTWPNSHVRAEVNKVVSRWAREDRTSGNGPGARASFYWDSPAPVQSEWQHSHSRTTSAAPSPVTAAPVRHSLPALSTTASAAFDWSSPSAPLSPDPWTPSKPDSHSPFTPTTLKHPAVTKVQRQEGRAVSVDLTPRKSEQALHKRTASALQPTHETTTATNLISPLVSSPSTNKADPWADPSIPDGLTTMTQFADVPANDDDDDDDEWGEMVQSPTVSSSFQLDPLPHSTSHANLLPPPPQPTRLSTVENSSRQAEPAETMDATPIVRLKTIISPTSAIFKQNAFIPHHAEQGPIGPGLLKPANRSARSTLEKTEVKPPPRSNEVGGSTVSKDITQVDGADDFSAWESAEGHQTSLVPAQTTTSPISHPSPPPSQPIRPSTPPPPAQQPIDAWADADFSIFESMPPPSMTTPQRRVQDPSDPFSIFDAPEAVSTTPKSFTRSPPRNATPPPAQPLTGATNSVQRRKAEEDQIIGDILRGLPDLGYMLR
jgi:hypothetical protein